MNRGFLFDVDNTLLDNDAVKTNLDQVLEVSLRREDTDLFWKLYEEGIAVVVSSPAELLEVEHMWI